jgi:circadian clock protein KaiB
MKRRSPFKFRLYVAGDALNSAQARINFSEICRTHFLDRHEIEIVDVFREPKRALADSIFMTPTLSQVPTVLQALGLEVGAA